MLIQTGRPHPLSNPSTAVAVCLILAGVLAAYGGALLNGFLIDDHSLITDNPLLREPGRLLDLLKSPYMGAYYRPAVLLSFFLDYRVWGLSAFGYHLTNLILHAINALLVFFFIGRLFRNPLWALVAGLLFAVHPLQTIPVNYIADRGNLLAALFSFLALILFDKAAENPRRPAVLFVTSYFCFVTALLSRESAVLLPFYAALCLMIKQRPGGVKVTEKGFLAILLLTAAAHLIVRQNLLTLFTGASFSWDRIAAFSFTVMKCGFHAVWPVDILWIREIRLSGAEHLLYPALAVLVLTLWTMGARRSRPVLFAGAWFLIGTVPLYGVMSSRPEIGLIMQDNQIYVAALGLLFLVAMGLVCLLALVRKPLWWLFLISLLSLYAVRSDAFTGLYRDPETFLRHWLSHSPRSHFAAANLGKLYFEQGDYDRALAMYRRSLTHYPKKDALTLLNIAGISFYRNDLVRAKELCAEAARMDPGLWQAYNYLGLLSEKEGDLAAAALHLRKAAEVSPLSPEPRRHLVRILEKQGEPDEAVTAALDLYRQFPSDLATGYTLIGVYLRQKQPSRAMEIARDMIGRSTEPAMVSMSCAVLFHEEGYEADAERLADQVYSLNPGPAKLFRDTGVPTKTPAR